METLRYPHALEDFLFMGCWNKDGCRSPGQAAVAAAIAAEPPTRPLFLGGDNIYPEKHDGKKNYPPARVAEGLACILPTSRDVFATIGNHNVASPHVLAAEKASHLWTIRDHAYALQFRNKTVVFLNSNLLDETEVSREGRDMLEALETTLVHLKRADIPYILIMHHPIISFKKKAYYLMPQHAAILDRLLLWPPQHILVADTHNYQKGRIHWKGTTFHQVVVGTGGADLDPIAALKTNRPLGSLAAADFAGTYTVEEAKVSYGYLRVLGDVLEFVELRVSPRKSPRTSPRASPRTRRSKRRQ